MQRITKFDLLQKYKPSNFNTQVITDTVLIEDSNNQFEQLRYTFGCMAIFNTYLLEVFVSNLKQALLILLLKPNEKTFIKINLKKRKKKGIFP